MIADVVIHLNSGRTVLVEVGAGGAKLHEGDTGSDLLAHALGKIAEGLCMVASTMDPAHVYTAEVQPHPRSLRG